MVSFVYNTGYPAAYNPAASLTTPTSLTNSTLATSLATNQVTTPLTAPQLPSTLTLAQQQSVAAFQATLAGALTSQNGGASAAAGANAGHLLQTNFQSAAAANRLNFSAVANGNIAANGAYQRTVAFGKQGFGFKHGVKRKADDGTEGDGKSDGSGGGGGELMTRLYCKVGFLCVLSFYFINILFVFFFIYPNNHFFIFLFFFGTSKCTTILDKKLFIIAKQ